MVFPAIHFKIIKIPFTTSRNTINPVRKTICEIMEPYYYKLQLQIYSKILILLSYLFLLSIQKQRNKGFKHSSVNGLSNILDSLL